MTSVKKTGVKRKFAVVRPNVLITTFTSHAAKFVNLQRVNFALAGLYALQALFVLMFGHAAKAPVTLNYLTSDALQTAAQHKTVLTLASHRWFDANLLALVVTVLLLAAAVHVLLATVLLKRYEDALTKQTHDVRWAGYALAGGLLLVTVGLVLGVADVAVLVALFGLCVVMAMGAMAVEANKRLSPWSLFAAMPAVATVLVLGAYMLGGALYGTALPGYACWVAALALFGMVGVAANLWLQIRGKDQWKDYLFAEEVYMALNFVAVSAITWLIFAGVLHG